MNFPRDSVIELDDDDDSLLSISSRPPVAASNEISLKQKQPTNALDWSSSDDDDDRISIVSPGNFGKPKAVPSHVLRQCADESDSDSEDDDSLDGIKTKLATSVGCKPFASLSQSSNVTTKSSSVSQTATSRSRCAVGTDRITLAQEKQAQKQKRNEERLRWKAEKENAKLNAKMERERQREEKKNAQLAEKQTKKRDREACQQASGKLAKKEIAVLIEKDRFSSSTYTVVKDLENMGYFVHDYPSALQCNAVQWIRHDALLGGAEYAVQQLQAGRREFQHFPVLTIVVDDALAFLKLLERSTDDHDDEEEDDYPFLEEWLKGIEYGWRAAWKNPSASNHTIEASPKQPRIILLLVRIPEGLDKLWVQYHKDVSSGRSQRTAPPTAEQLHDAITWILIQFQIECVHCKSTDDVSLHLCKITRLLAESPYRQPVTELACIKKIKTNPTGGDGIEEGTDLDRATDCWIRQLQQIPGISQARALHFSSFYPTAMSLWTAYQDDSLTIQEKRSLIADCFHPTKSHTKLSNQLYTVMTSQNPNEMVTWF